MANPIKVIKKATKVVKRTVVGSNKDVKTNKGINKKLEQTFGAKTISQGKSKAANRMAKAGQYDSNTKGLGLAKGSNKKTAKQNLMASPFKDSIQKHPLVRNTGESSAEGKYRYNRGNPIPVKKRGK